MRNSHVSVPFALRGHRSAGLCRVLGPWDRKHCDGRWHRFWRIKVSCLPQTFFRWPNPLSKCFKWDLVSSHTSNCKPSSAICGSKSISPHPTASLRAYNWKQSLANTALLTFWVTVAMVLNTVDARNHVAAEDLEQSRWMIIRWIDQTKDEWQSNASSPHNSPQLVSFLL